MLFQKSKSISKEGKSVSCVCFIAQAFSLMSPRWPRLNSVSGRVWFVVNKVVLIQVCVLVFDIFVPCHATNAAYSSSPLYHSYHKRSGRSLEKFKEIMFLKTSGTIGQKNTLAYCLLTSFMLQNFNFIPVYAEKKVQRSKLEIFRAVNFLLPCSLPLICSSFPKEV